MLSNGIRWFSHEGRKSLIPFNISALISTAPLHYTGTIWSKLEPNLAPYQASHGEPLTKTNTKFLKTI